MTEQSKHANPAQSINRSPISPLLSEYAIATLMIPVCSILLDSWSSKKRALPVLSVNENAYHYYCIYDYILCIIPTVRSHANQSNHLLSKRLVTCKGPLVRVTACHWWESSRVSYSKCWKNRNILFWENSISRKRSLDNHVSNFSYSCDEEPSRSNFSK